MNDNEKSKEQLIRELEQLRQDNSELVKSRKDIESTSYQFSRLIDIGVILDMGGFILFLNDASIKLTGYEPQELIGKSFALLFDDNDIKLGAKAFSQIIHGNGASTVVRFRKTGFICEFKSQPLVNVNGGITGAIAIGHDITKRRKVEEALRVSEENLNNILDSSLDVIYRIDLNTGAYDCISKSMEKITGYTVKEIMDMGREGLDKKLHPENPLHDVEPDKRLKNLATLRDIIPFVEYRFKHKDGEYRWFSDSRVIIRDADNNPCAIIGSIRDVTEHKLAEKALQDSENKFRSITENAADSIFIEDVDRRYTFANKSMIDILGLTEHELLGRKPNEVFGAEQGRFFTEFDDRAFSGEIVNETQAVSLGNKKFFFNTVQTPLTIENGKVTSIMGIARDVTEAKMIEESLLNSEEKLRQAQKMESVGRLAGGVAHDFNNLLTTIIGYSELISMTAGLADSTKEGIEEIRNSADRAAKLTQQLLTFSAKQIVKPTAIDLNYLVENLIKMLKRLIGENIELSTKLDAGIGRIEADVGQIEQVIMNIAINAKDAISEHGTITIETQSVILDESYRKELPEVIPGEYVLLAISDTGHGMDKNTQAQAFEPFFTTKGIGEGTGLGLASVYGSVKQSNGFIYLYSELGHGSTFKIYLPSINGTENQQSESLEKPYPLGGTETILLVEDDESLRKLAALILKGYGYIIIEAENGVEATKIAKGNHPEIDLLVTDVTMPKMSGRELSERLLRDNPRLKVLFISGYTNHAIDQRGVIDEGLSFLQKPFSRNSLAKKVREVLDLK